jgi:Amt family ammonium transporter
MVNITFSSDPDLLKSEYRVNTTEEAVNEMLILMSTAFILQIQLGFAMIENGLVRSKNSQNILIKNLFDVIIGGIAFWIFGFAFAFGNSPGGFIGID